MRTVCPLPSSSRGPSGDKYILENGDGDVVHVNFFTVGDTNTLSDGDGG
jgi:hypothetical protein